MAVRAIFRWKWNLLDLDLEKYSGLLGLTENFLFFKNVLNWKCLLLTCFLLRKIANYCMVKVYSSWLTGLLESLFIIRL